MDRSRARTEERAAYDNMSNSDKVKAYLCSVWKKVVSMTAAIGIFLCQTKLEWEVLKVAWPWIILGIIFQILHDWAHNWVYYLSGK